ncbi:hypothetical protein [Alphaproteobacteria bacterium endosymbiont of Tiliacea citrago]|uniref:hypothetical protein n=1 Tax=Alphaproteobacteria bacterium endosymbiont of Tiliacea citrago TaxID=3077944 RepID=UPI00313A96BB
MASFSFGVIRVVSNISLIVSSVKPRKHRTGASFMQLHNISTSFSSSVVCTFYFCFSLI